MIAMRMGDEDFFDFSEIVARLHNPLGYAAPCVNQIGDTVHNEQV